MEKHRDVDQEVYEMPNRGIVLEPGSLRTKEQPTWH
jgi:hypothetical protein